MLYKTSCSEKSYPIILTFYGCIQNYWKVPVKEFILNKFSRFLACTLLKRSSSSIFFKDLEHKSGRFWWHSWWLLAHKSSRNLSCWTLLGGCIQRGVYDRFILLTIWILLVSAPLTLPLNFFLVNYLNPPKFYKRNSNNLR